MEPYKIAIKVRSIL